MENIKVCFVILHYKTYRDTIGCVKSINAIEGGKNIIIVDNASNNGSFEKVKSKIKHYNNVYFIHNQNNLGFAAGNNIGYEFAKEHLKSNMIIICNNDVIFDDKYFITKLVNYYNNEDFDVAGPDIESLIDGKHQNPMKFEQFDIHRINKEMFKYRLLAFFNEIYIYDVLKKISEHITKFNKSSGGTIDNKNIMLHGSVVIFSPRFIKNEKFAFRPGTFLYLEENLLSDYCKKKDYKMVYLPNLHVFHKEDSSTNAVVSKSRKKREFIFKNLINSFKIYKNQLIRDKRQ